MPTLESLLAAGIVLGSPLAADLDLGFDEDNSSTWRVRGTGATDASDAPSIAFAMPVEGFAGGVAVVAGGSLTGEQGGDIDLLGGSGDAGNQPAGRVLIGGGHADAPGVVTITTDGADITLRKMPHLADGSSVDDLRDLLITAGLMAAS